MRSSRKRAEHLHQTVDALPRHTRVAMLDGIRKNHIIVGAYSNRGGICPMLAAHRNGGRTDFGSFARAWDLFTDASAKGRKARRATKREVRALCTYLEMSLLRDEQDDRSLADLAGEIREDRRRMAWARVRDYEHKVEEGETRASEAEERAARAEERARAARTAAKPRRDTGERHRARELRLKLRWSWLRPTRRLDEFEELLAAAEQQFSEQRADDVLGPREPAVRA